MPHTNLREMAFQSRASELRQYASDLLIRKPESEAAAEVLDLMAYLIECDFKAAEAKISTIEYRYKKTKFESYVDEAVSLAATHINFAYGRFNEMEKTASNFFTKHNSEPELEQGEYLDVLRLMAQKSMLLDDFKKLSEIRNEIKSYQSEERSTNFIYLINSVEAMYLMSCGEFLKAQEVAIRNISIAKQNKYQGLMAPIDSMYVLGRCQLAGAKNHEALETFSEIKQIAKKFSQWPWYFFADGYFSREYAITNQMSEALAVVREEREMLANFNFKHDLNFIPDINELYARHIIKDIDRIQVLLERVPNLIMVQQIKALKREWSGVDMLGEIQLLPEETSREKIYKLVALSEYYSDKESLAVDYMIQALKISEETGQVEFILRQYRLFDIIQKAIAKKPTTYLEFMSTKIAERIRVNNEKNRRGLPVPLTSRELEIVKHLSTGKSISLISNSLHVSMNTMKTHLRNIYRKLEVDGRESAVVRAKELFLI
jgi:ATP/maltotriose-dependent transcriptional regulator MalT